MMHAALTTWERDRRATAVARRGNRAKVEQPSGDEPILRYTKTRSNDRAGMNRKKDIYLALRIARGSDEPRRSRQFSAKPLRIEDSQLRINKRSASASRFSLVLPPSPLPGRDLYPSAYANYLR